MQFQTATEIISIIKTERQRRLDSLNDQDPDVAYDQWLFTDEPFINEMCLMVLVALRHQIERTLSRFAACAGGGAIIDRDQYLDNIARIEKKGWQHVCRVLGLQLPQRGEPLETLRLLSNCYKHQTRHDPSQKLLDHLDLPLAPNGSLVVEYATLPDSHAFREGLANSVGLDKNADYCTISKKFVEIAEQFLNNLEGRLKLAKIRISLDKFCA